MSGADAPPAAPSAAVPRVAFVAAVPSRDNAMPVYPEDLLALHLPPLSIAVRLDIDAHGAVTGVASVDPFPTPGQARFLDVVREACRRWTYSPPMRLDLDAGPTTVGEGAAAITYPGRPTALPFHLDEQFVFSQQDGVPVVEHTSSGL